MAKGHIIACLLDDVVGLANDGGKTTGGGWRGLKCKKAPAASLDTEAAAQAPSFCFYYVAVTLLFFQDGRI